MSRFLKGALLSGYSQVYFLWPKGCCSLWSPSDLLYWRNLPSKCCSWWHWQHLEIWDLGVLLIRKATCVLHPERSTIKSWSLAGPKWAQHLTIHFLSPFFFFFCWNLVYPRKKLFSHAFGFCSLERLLNLVVYLLKEGKAILGRWIRECIFLIYKAELRYLQKGSKVGESATRTACVSTGK